MNQIILHSNRFSIYICKYLLERIFFSVFFGFFYSEENIQVITEISENASKEYSIERILEKITQTWDHLKFETTIYKPNIFKLK